MSDRFEIPPQLPPAPRRERSNACLYGCLGITLLFFIGLGALGYFAYRGLNSMVQTYTQEAPASLPPLELDEPARLALRERVDAFAAALNGAGGDKTLVLTADEVNVLIDEYREQLHPIDLQARVQFVEDRVQAQVSMPLDLFNMRGRYFNGTAEASVGLQNGQLFVFLESLTAGEHAVPDVYMAGFRNENIAEEALNGKPELQEAVSKLESIAIEDGKLVLVAKENL